MNESPGSFELLSSRVDELEKRVHALEHPDEAIASGSHVDRRVRSAVTRDGETILFKHRTSFRFWAVRCSASPGRTCCGQSQKQA